MSQKTAFYVLSLIVIFFIGILMYKTHDDFFYYHFQYTISLIEFKKIFGVGNLEHGWRTPSSIFYFNSLFYLPILEKSLINSGAIYFLIFSNIFLIQKVSNQLKNKKFMIVGMCKTGNTLGIFYTLSDDLIHWSQRILVKTWNTNDYTIGEADTREASNSRYWVGAVSIIDHNSSSRNFSTIGQEVYLYYMEGQPKNTAVTLSNGLSSGSYNRKIKRQKNK